MKVFYSHLARTTQAIKDSFIITLFIIVILDGFLLPVGKNETLLCASATEGGGRGWGCTIAVLLLVSAYALSIQ